MCLCVSVCVSGRGRRSPKSRKKTGQMNGGVYEDRDQLINTETDGTYRKYPGVSNFAYVVRHSPSKSLSFSSVSHIL